MALSNEPSSPPPHGQDSGGSGGGNGDLEKVPIELRSSSDKAKGIVATEADETVTTSDGDVSSLRKGEDILALQDLDPALNAKMHLVNNVS